MKGIHCQECSSFVNERLAVCACATRMSSTFANRKVTCSKIKSEARSGRILPSAISRSPNSDVPNGLPLAAGSAAFREIPSGSRSISQTSLPHSGNRQETLVSLPTIRIARTRRSPDRSTCAGRNNRSLLPALGAEQITHSRVSFYDPEFDSAGCQLPMQRR